MPNSKKVDALKAKILAGVDAGDIAALYVLESQAQELFDEETLIMYYSNILELALENLTNGLEVMKRFDITDVQDFSTLRALYEYAMEHYAQHQLSDAAALFEILSGLSNDERFSSAMKVHMQASNAKMDLDDFLEQVADLEATQQFGSFYISSFNESAQKMLNSSN